VKAHGVAETAKALVAGDKGLLAMDECHERPFARAIQQPALEIWRGEAVSVPAAQQALFHRADCNRAARRGECTAAMENA
jgi:fructose-bisphosphate aldolase class 1